MAETTGISWTHSTFNPWIGCSKVHTGCANCYAERDFAIRRKRVNWGPNGTRSRTSDSNWREPLRWNKEAAAAGERRRVFCSSLADIFEDWDQPIVDHKGEKLFRDDVGRYAAVFEKVASARPATMNDLRHDLFGLIDQTPNLDWLLLTKRPENIDRMWVPRELKNDYPMMGDRPGKSKLAFPSELLRPHEAQAQRNHSQSLNRLAERGGLSATEMRWIIEGKPWQIGDKCDWNADYEWLCEYRKQKSRYRPNVWLGTSISDQPTTDAWVPRLMACRDLAPVLFLSAEPLVGQASVLNWLKRPGMPDRIVKPGSVPVVYIPVAGVDWVIVGCESGQKRRPMDDAWARSLLQECRGAKVAYFLKQMEVDGEVCHDLGKFPADLRVQEFPA